MEIEQLNLDQWLSVLKPYQIKTITNLVQKYGEEEAAKIWIESKGPINTVTFGGLPSNTQNRNYYEALKLEIHKFICGQDNYKEERKKIIGTGDVINTAVSTKMAVIFSPIIGVSVPVLLPALLLILKAISKISVNAFCSMSFNEENKE